MARLAAFRVYQAAGVCQYDAPADSLDDTARAMADPGKKEAAGD
jgi:hypothetical protein